MHQTSIEHLSGVIETWYLPGPRATSSKVDSHLNTMEVTFFVVHLAFCLFVLTCLQSQRSRLSSEVKWDFRWEYPPPEEFKVQVCSSVSSLHTMYKRFCHLSLPRYPEMKGARYVCFLKCSGASLSIKYSDFFFLFIWLYSSKCSPAAFMFCAEDPKSLQMEEQLLTVLVKDPGFYKPLFHRACGIVANRVQLCCA